MQALYYGLPKCLRGKESGKPVMQEMQVRFLGGEDLLEKEIATHSSILAWEIPWTEESVGLLPMGSQKSWTGLSDSVQFSHSVVSDSLQPHESQHTRPPCPPPTPGVHSDSRPSSQ